MKTSFALLLPAVLMALTTSANADEWNKRWTVSANPELRVYTNDAAVTIEGTEGNDIEASLTTRGWSIGGSGVQVTDHQSGNRVEIQVHVPSLHFSFSNHSVRLELRVPRSLSTDIHTGDGSITLRDVRGALRADTGDGSIHGEDLDGTLDAHTGDGSVHIAGRFDNVQLRTNDGSVELNARNGSRMQSDWRVQTGDGSVQVSIPHDLAADVELHTGDGRIHLDLPLMINGTQNEHDIRGKLNGGGPLLTVRTGDGSISINAS